MKKSEIKNVHQYVDYYINKNKTNELTLNLSDNKKVLSLNYKDIPVYFEYNKPSKSVEFEYKNAMFKYILPIFISILLTIISSFFIHLISFKVILFFIFVGTFIIVHLCGRQITNRYKKQANKELVKYISNKKVYFKDNVFLLSDFLDIDQSKPYLFVYHIPKDYSFNQSDSELSQDDLNATFVILSSYELTNSDVDDYIKRQQELLYTLIKENQINNSIKVNESINKLKNKVYEQRQNTQFKQQLEQKMKELKKEQEKDGLNED